MARTMKSSPWPDVSDELRLQMEEAEDTLRAISRGEVDALVVREQEEERVYTLKSADRPYRLMIEFMAQGAVTLSPEGLVLYCNSGFAKMVGVPLQSLIGSSIWDLVAPSGRDLFEALLKQPEGNPQGEIQLRTAAGEPLPVYIALSGLPLEEPGEPMRCLVVTDLTEQKRSERIVRDEKLARSILDHAAEVMVVCDREGRILRANPEAHRLCGRNPLLEPFESAFPIELAPRDAGGVGSARELLEQVLAGERLRGLEASLDAGRVDLMVSAGPLWGPEQAVEGCVITLMDITARRRAERDLERAWAAAEAMNQAKDRFLATLSHELRTPLTPVVAVVSRLAEEERLPEHLRRDLAMVRRNVELEAHLIDDLLDLTRIARGKIELDRRIVDLHEILEHAIQISCGRHIASASRRVEVDLGDGRPHLLGDASRLTQVFWNVLNNAVKFTPDGGTIAVSSRGEPAGIRIEISDTGIGIPPAVLPRIFDAFEQGEPGVTRRFGGLGLGLAISKAIVELHGGTIEVRSDGLERGTTVAICLPADPALAPRETRPGRGPEAFQAPAEGLRILLVEDHFDTAFALADLIRLRGHQVQVAPTLAAALAEAASAPFDLVVSDVGLPDGSGHDLMRQLSARYGLRGLALSGYGMDEDVRRSRAAGFEVHLTKPVSMEALEAAIQLVAGRRRPPEG